MVEGCGYVATNNHVVEGSNKVTLVAAMAKELKLK